MRPFALFFALVLPGCFSNEEWCHDATCSSAPDPCEGQCVPFVGGGWAPVLALATEGAASVRCPEVAPFEAMSSAAPPVTACGVQAAEGACSAEGYVCLPPPGEWATCVVRDGAHACPAAYPAPMPADSTVTLCCLSAAGPS